jgi:hypothetical protein
MASIYARDFSRVRARCVPVVVLVAELEVEQHDRDLGARDEEDDEHDEEEAEHVVELIQPHRGHDEEQLDEHRTRVRERHNEGRRTPHAWTPLR